VKNACSSASRTNAVFIDVAARQPTTRRANASITNATYTIPVHVRQYVKSYAQWGVGDHRPAMARAIADVERTDRRLSAGMPALIPILLEER
jgi:hypothetical protein